MRSPRLVLAAALSGAALLALPATSVARHPATHAGPCVSAHRIDRATAARVLSAINAARARSGAPPLSLAAPLERRADRLSRLTASGRPAKQPGALITRCRGGVPSPGGATRLWLASSSSRRVALAAGYRTAGIGVASRASHRKRISALALVVGEDPVRTASTPVPTLPHQVDAHVPPGATWYSTFEDGNPWSKWEGYNQPLQVIQGGAHADQIQVVDSAAAGIPAPPGYVGATKVLLTQVDAAEFAQYADNYPRSYCCVQAKLFHGWGGSNPGDSRAMAPGQESGSYRAWYYLPPDTPTFSSQASHVHWAQLLQWKTVSRSGQQTVAAEADLLPVDGKVWMCLGPGWGACWTPNSNNAVPAPLGRWFELRADFVHGGHIDWFVDGRRVWKSNGAASLQAGQSWIFGVGHYGGVGRYYTKNASFSPFR